MRSLIRNVALTVLVVLVSLWAIYPPEENLRRGKDLAGGVTLVYPVEIEARENARETISRMIEVLKKRVNPTGAMDIAMVAQGDNRIEISMPLPSQRVRELKERYEAALAALGALSLDEGELERTIRLPEGERSAAIAALTGGDAKRTERLMAAAQAYDAARSARAAYEAAREAGAGAEVIDPLVEAATDAELAYEKARSAALALSVDPEELRHALELPTAPKTIVDHATGEAESIPGPRAQAVERIRERHPDARELIDAAIVAHDAFAAERKGLDDPADLMRLLRGAGVLEFRIAVAPGELGPEEERLRAELRERGPRGARSTTARWYAVESPDAWYDSVQQLRDLKADPRGYFANQYRLVAEERDGQFYILLFDAPGLRLTEAEGDWKVADSFPQPDQRGLPAIAFRMDARGGKLLGDLTGANQGKQMAVVLDDKVYTAPRLNGRITTHGIIETGGGFAPAEIDYITRTLRAGALAGKLGETPLAVDVTGPELGADNLRKGLVAGVYSFLLVALFMVLWYFTSGAMAVLALVVNAIMLLGMMALSGAAFTMPGIAGVILTFGMAVDANVLIYERMREEVRSGQNLKAAVRIAFQRATSAIVDGNLTNLIVCFALYWTGTTEIRGFAVTLGIGVITTLFSAMVVSRLAFQILLATGWKRFATLPDVVKPLGRILLPDLDWLRYRWVFYIVSVVMVSIGVGALAIESKNMFDNEFRGGTAVTIELKKEDPDGAGPAPAAPIKRTRLEIQQRLRDHVAALGAGSPVAEMVTADVVALNPDADQVTASTFKIKTVVTDPTAVSKEVIEAFSDILDAHPPIELAAIRSDPIVQPALGENIGRPGVRDDVEEYVGGVAIVVEGLEPPIPLSELRTRLAHARSQPDYADTVGRQYDAIVLEGTAEAVRSAAVVAVDRAVSFFDDEARWRSDVAQAEQTLVREALERATSLAGVQSFSAAIASDFAAKAITSALLSLAGILIYLWVRFGSVRYSLAAVVADIHDAMVAVGLVALAGIIYETMPGLAAALGLAPFKINLAMTAAILTVLGYSLNDSIVIMDRVRENRGKLAYASREIVNRSLNQTLARTILTGGTTLSSALILYTFGGEGIRGFAFAIFVGVIAGTYSSIGLAAPIVWVRKPPAARPAGAPSAAKSDKALVTT